MTVGVLAPKLGYVKIGPEAVARGTAAASMTSLAVDSKSLKGKFTRIRPKYQTNSIHEVGPLSKGRQGAAGDLSGPVLVDTIGILLKAIMGTDTKTGAGPDYTHAFTVATLPPTTTIEKNIGGLGTSQQFVNASCSKLSFTGRVEQDDAVLEFQSSWMSKAPTQISATAWTPVTEQEIPAALSTFTYGVGGGAAQTDDLLAEFQIDLNRVTGEVKGANNTLDPSDIVGTLFTVSGYLDLYFLDWTKHADFVAMTEEVVQIKVALSASKAIEFQLPKAYLLDFDPEEGQQFVKQRFPIGSIYDSTAGTLGAVKVVLTNQAASAY